MGTSKNPVTRHNQPMSLIGWLWVRLLRFSVLRQFFEVPTTQPS